MALKVNGLFDNRYRLVKRLSDEGATADVWLAIDTLTLNKRINDENDVEAVADDDSGTRVAIKIYRPKNALDVEGESLFVKEFKTAYNCQHENLLAPTGYGIANDIPYLVMPYCSKGSAENLVGKMTDEKEVWKFLQQTAAGLAYLHSCKPPIIHQDIKPGNILIDDNGNYRITDFGISVKRDYKGDSFLDDKDSGTTDYMPPERFKDGFSSLPIPESDIWSLGATAFELLTGKTPFGTSGGEKQNRNTPFPKIVAPVSNNLKRIISSCIEANATKRPTAEAIVDLAKNHGHNNHSIISVASLLLAFLIIGFFVLWSLKSEPYPKKDFIDLFTGTWVFDHPELGIWEKNEYLEQGLFHSQWVSHDRVFDFEENGYGRYWVKNMNFKAKFRVKDGTIIEPNWDIEHINELEFTFTDVEGASRFTYSRILDEVELLSGTTSQLKSQLLVPRAMTSINGSGESSIVKPIFVKFKSHDEKIVQVDSITGLFTGLNHGRTYIDVVTTEGSAAIEVNVIDTTGSSR